MKKEQVIELLKQYGVTDQEMDGLDYNSLRSLLKEMEDRFADANVEKTPVDRQDEEEETTYTDNIQGVLEEESDVDKAEVDYTVKLRVSESKIVIVDPKAKIVVTNEGFGDLYVSADTVSFNPLDRVEPNGKKVFEGVSRIFLRSYSRPVVRIQHFKK